MTGSWGGVRSQFAESKLDRVRGGFCDILLNRLITAGSGGTAPLIKTVNNSISRVIRVLIDKPEDSV